jgi:hypothetical protein
MRDLGKLGRKTLKHQDICAQHLKVFGDLGHLALLHKPHNI